MRLAAFLQENLEEILNEWEGFAGSIWPHADPDPAELRDDAAAMLLAVIHDMGAAQSEAQRHSKSEGRGHHTDSAQEIGSAAARHAVERVRSGFDLKSLVSEYRALRASVLRLWRQSNPGPHDLDLDDLTRFNESIDQSLSEAIHHYASQVDRARNLFIAIVGHDLRTPLNAVSLSAQNLLYGGSLAEGGAPMANQIVASCDHMSRMVADLLDLASTSLGQSLPIDPAPADLAAICREVVSEQGTGHANREIQLDIVGDTNGRWDPERLRQALDNLLGNALQHSPEGTPVRCVIRGEDREITVQIHNGGPPIPPETVDTLFSPLGRARAAIQRPTRHKGSLGIGLYIAHQIITAHKGHIDVASTPDGGTTFTVRLPRQAE